MKLKITFFFLLATVLAFSQNADIGKSFINTLLIEKDIPKAYAFFDESVKSKIPAEQLSQMLPQLEAQLGKFKEVVETNNTAETYFYYSAFENMKLDIQVAFNENSKIIGFFFKPHQEFNKLPRLGIDLNIKNNAIELKGTLYIAGENNLKKLVIFVHGSGPNDRDETIFETKPFQDIAETLHKSGISSYRFDKRTFTNPESFTEKSTIDDEVTNDVVAIVNYFKNDPVYSQYEIIVLGHSLGANLMPRIVNQSNNQISKVVLMAGNSRPLTELIIEQYEYINKVVPEVEINDEIEKIKTQVAFLNSKDFDVTSPKEKLPLNQSGYYWKSIVDYNPLNEVTKVKIPMLILQGERDYQVTMKDFELWKKTLSKNKKVKFISYPKLNHLFITGDTISEPKEYKVKGTVDEKVIADIAVFIQGH